MPEFDVHASIRRLAEAEWIRKSVPDFEGDSPDDIGTQSMEVPFASLRVGCINCSWTGRCGPGPGGTRDCGFCEGRGWVPEQNGAAAYWKVFKALLNQEVVGWWLDSRNRWCFSKGETITKVESVEEAILRAAEAWLKEQHAAS